MVDDARALHDQIQAAGVPILVSLFDTPFGLTFVFRTPTATPSPSTAPRPPPADGFLQSPPPGRG